MEDCLFCKIIKGDIPSQKIYEDDNVFVFLDIAPTNPGHTLVVPKNHSTDILDMPEEDIANVFTAAKKVAKAIMKATKCDGINIGMNNKPAAGQIIFHSHVHIIPRLKNDGFKHWQGTKTETEELEKVKDLIMKEL